MRARLSADETINVDRVTAVSCVACLPGVWGLRLCAERSTTFLSGAEQLCRETSPAGPFADVACWPFASTVAVAAGQEKSVLCVPPLCVRCQGMC